MEDLKRMAVFAAVVQHGSMSGAARALGMSTSAVSQQVRKLESDGGVTLLHRSTRKLALTEVELRTHYEGCFGKPGTHAETTPVGNLGVGAQASARVPMLTRSPGSPDGRNEFHAYSVQLVGKGEGVVIDLDVRFSQLGVPVACPKD